MAADIYGLSRTISVLDASDTVTQCPGYTMPPLTITGGLLSHRHTTRRGSCFTRMIVQSPTLQLYGAGDGRGGLGGSQARHSSRWTPESRTGGV